MRPKQIFFTTLLTLLLSAPLAFSASLEGTIVSVRPGMLTVNIGGNNLETNLKINHDTELQYIDELNSLNIGDWVHISYWRKNGHMIAASIVKEEKGPGVF